LPQEQAVPFNKGGTVDLDGVRFTMTNAFHSSSNDAAGGVYGGEPTGVVIRFDDTSVYFAGDTCVFGDMQLIARLYAPQVAVLPIGDHYTMGPEEAALALELLGNPRCVPCHWGTFGLLTGTPEKLAELTSATVERLRPGDSVEL
jgi:L-ascorbate metabolism protein UlaG (beta-lactamase superfamily)